MARVRDYKAEYARRLAKGQAAGKTRQAARGHARGEAANVRPRPTMAQERANSRERGQIFREYSSEFSEGARMQVGGRRFGRSLRNGRIYAQPAGVFLFVYRGIPKTESPPLDDQGIARVTIPIRPQGTYAEALAQFRVLEREARSQAEEYLEEPQLEAVGTTQRAIAEGQ